MFAAHSLRVGDGAFCHLFKSYFRNTEGRGCREVIMVVPRVFYSYIPDC